jgi:hypothetical protein
MQKQAEQAQAILLVTDQPQVQPQAEMQKQAEQAPVIRLTLPAEVLVIHLVTRQHRMQKAVEPVLVTHQAMDQQLTEDQPHQVLTDQPQVQPHQVLTDQQPLDRRTDLQAEQWVAMQKPAEQAQATQQAEPVKAKAANQAKAAMATLNIW